MSENITNNPSVPTQVVAEVKFPRFVNNLGIIPTSYKDSMDYYETLAWLCNYLEKTVIPTVNQNGGAVQELQALYIQLNDYVTHYFDNLDVQEEINNKLDDMVEAGTLQEIIGDYLNANAVWCFDTVSDMKNSTNLINGSFARTLGYHSKNDGGSATYKIRTITNDDIIDEMFILEMENDNTLVAELIVNGIFIPEQIGAKNDATENSGDYFQAIFDKMVSNNKLLLSGTYLIEKPLYLPNYSNIVISGGTLKATSSFNGYILNSNISERMQPSGWENATENMTIENLFIDGNYVANGLYLNEYLRVKVVSCTFHNFKNYGIYINTAGNEAQIIGSNFIGRENGHEAVENIGLYIGATDNLVDSCEFAYCQWAIDIHRQANLICNSHFYCNQANGGNIKISAASFNSFVNNYFDGSGLYMINPFNTNIDNNLFYITDNTKHIIKFDHSESIANPNIKGVFITNSQCIDVRTNKTDIEMIECTFTPTEVSNNYIDKIVLPTNILLSNPKNIFAFKNSDTPMILTDSYFRANNTNHTIGTHSVIDNYYEVKSCNGNFIETNYIGSTSAYPWFFCKIYVPEKMKITKNMITTSNSIEFFDSSENYIDTNSATLDKGYYYVGIYRTADLYLSTN